MTLERAVQPRSGPARIGPSHFARVILLLTVGLFVILAAGLMVVGFAVILRIPAGGVSAIGGATASLAFAELVRRSARPGPDPITLIVDYDEIGFERRGEVVDRINRTAVGVVVVEGFRRAGVRAITVWDPGGELLGRWSTGWVGKSELGPWRTLGRYGWPRAIEELGRVRKVSTDAPLWARERQGCRGIR